MYRLCYFLDTAGNIVLFERVRTIRITLLFIYRVNDNFIISLL